MALALITQPDTWEVVLHAVSDTIAIEQAAQQAQAIAAGITGEALDAYDYYVCEDADSAEVRHDDDGKPLPGALVRVSLNRLNKAPGSNWAQQRYQASLEVTVVSWGAYPQYIRKCQAIARNVRQFLTSPINTHLGLTPGTVHDVQVVDIAFAPLANVGTQDAHSASLQLTCGISETAEQATGPILEGFNITLTRSSDGRVLATLTQDIS